MVPLIAAIPPLVSLGAQFAPALARWLGGERAGEVAAAVGEVVRHVTGTDDADRARALLVADPAKAMELQVALAGVAAQREAEERQAEQARLAALLGDVANARAQTIALTQAGSRLAWMPAVFSVALVAGFFAVLYALLGLGQDLPAGIRDVALVLIGVLGSEFKTATQYWLGTSRGAVEMRIGLQRQGGAA